MLLLDCLLVLQHQVTTPACWVCVQVAAAQEVATTQVEAATPAYTGQQADTNTQAHGRQQSIPEAPPCNHAASADTKLGWQNAGHRPQALACKRANVQTVLV